MAAFLGGPSRPGVCVLKGLCDRGRAVSKAFEMGTDIDFYQLPSKPLQTSSFCALQPPPKYGRNKALGLAAAARAQLTLNIRPSC